MMKSNIEGDTQYWLKSREEFGNELLDKCWTKKWAVGYANTSKMYSKEGKMLDEMFDGDQNFIQHNFHSSNTIFSSFSNFAIG